jgi:Fibronectin type III domain
MPGVGLSVGVKRTGFVPSKFARVQGFSTSNTSNSITLNWIAPAAGSPTSYQVERTAGVFPVWVDLQTVTPPTTTYTYSGFSASTYYVRVRAVYAAGNSSWTQSGAITLATAASYPPYYTLGIPGYAASSGTAASYPAYYTLGIPGYVT